MNPLFLLLGFFGANAFVNAFGSDDDDSAGAVSAAPSDDAGDSGGNSTSGQEPSGDDVSGSGRPLTNGPTGTTPDAPTTVGSNTPQEEQDTEAPATNTPAPTTTAPDFTPVNTPVAEAQSGQDSDGGANAPLAAEGNVTVMAGRVATLGPPADDIVGLEITSDVAHGNLTINPDGTLALVMTQSNFIGNQSFSYSAQHTDGSTTSHTVNLNVQPGLQAQGWGTSELHYMLATDANDKIIVEHGESHVKVHISGSNSALSRADIAQQEGVNINQVTGQFLAESGYGQTEALALDETTGKMLWDHVTPDYSSTSNWLLLERGFEYENLGSLVGREVSGESELNPLLIGAWGQGSAPELTEGLNIVRPGDNTNIILQDLHISEYSLIANTDNIILDNLKLTDMLAIQNSDSVTIRNSDFYDIHREMSLNGGAFEAHPDRIQGLYMNDNAGVLVENNFFDRNGWHPEGQDPSMFSHNLYFGATMDDVTLRDNIFMRGASYGAQVRAGGFIEDNVFLDNNAGFSAVGGDYNGAGPVGNYTLMSDNLVTSGAHKVADLIGAYAMGIYETGELTTMVDNIVTHLADPDNPAEFQQKIWNHHSNYTESTVYDDTIVYNWKSSHKQHGNDQVDQNIDGLDTSVLDQTTIQRFAAQLLGSSNATIEDLANYLRGQAEGALDDVVDADLIIQFFQTGFGVAADIRDDAATLRFVPDDLADGVRWDNRLNWDTEDLPGLHSGDNVDLGGNEVVFGTNAEINWLDTGDGGTLSVVGGRLDVEAGFTGHGDGSLMIDGAGQVWADGSDASNLEIDMDGGRFVNEGVFEGASLEASDGQAILATGGARFELGNGDTLSVAGSAQAGFDGSGGQAILDLQEGSTLAFEADENGLGSIEEFRSGAFANDPNVQSGIDLGDATLSIDLAGLSAADGTQFTLMSADEIAGIFDDASVTGLGGRSAKIIIDYEADAVTLELSSGNGSVDVETVGSETDVSNGYQALWNELTTDHGLVSNTAQARLPGNEEEEADESGFFDSAA